MSEDRARFEQRVGSVVGGYVLEDVVGSGGMGVVYRAHQGETGRVVALKLMLPEIAANRRFRERFILEAQVAPELDHPHIVPVFEVGDSAGELFIAMRLVEGVDLKHLVETSGSLEPKRALGLMRQAASALDYAHERGVVHRDVKPQNFLLTETEAGDGHLYLTDFGLVKPTSNESTASRTSDVFGSIQYMSPEHIEGMAIDGRADVYSLACVAFECLTAKPPFERPNEIALLWAHVHEEPPRPTDVLRSLPGGVDLVLRQAMSKHPDDRYLTCGEFVDALEEGVKQHRRQLVAPVMRPLVKRTPRPKTEREVWAPNFFPELSRVRKLTGRTNWVQVAAVTAVLCLLAASLVQFGREGGIPQAAADVVELVQDAGGGIVSALPGSSDGGDDASASGFDPGTGAAGEDRPGVRRASSGRPSGGSSGSLAMPPGAAAGEAPARSGPAPAPGTLPLAPAVPKIVWVSGKSYGGSLSDLWVMGIDGQRKTQLTATPTSDENWPDWSPDGKRLVYIRDGDIWIMNADGSDQHGLSLCSMKRPCSEPEWSPDGTRIVYSAATEDLPATAYETFEAAIFIHYLRSGRRRLVPGLSASVNTDRGTVVNASWSPDGRWIAGTCSEPKGLCVVRPDGTALKRWDHSARSLAWSPDGSTIAGEAGSAYGSQDICLTPWKGSACKDLLPDATDQEPSWSSDASALVYADNEDRRYVYAEIYRVDADGSNPARLTSWAETTDVQPDWWGPAN